MEKKSHFKKGMGIAVFFVIISLFFSAPPAAMGREKSAENNQMIYVKPEILYRHVGFVQRVGEDEIVVDDHLLKLARNVVYHTPGRGRLASRKIKEGSQIGFNRNDKKEITDIWILKSK